MPLSERFRSKEALIGVSLMAIGGLLVGLSELTQNHLELYYHAQAILGTGSANFILGQLGDLSMTAFFFPGLGTTVSVILSDSKETMEKLAPTGAVSSGIFGSLWYLTSEVIDVFDVKRQTTCGDPGKFCPGELTDMIAFSAPLFASAAYQVKKRFMP